MDVSISLSLYSNDTAYSESIHKIAVNAQQHSSAIKTPSTIGYGSIISNIGKGWQYIQYINSHQSSSSSIVVAPLCHKVISF
jgi:hypothetical protein